MQNESATVGIRIPQWMKDDLTISALRKDISMNAEINNRLKSSFSAPETINSLFDTLDLNKIHRLRSTSTTSDADRIIFLISNLIIEKIILGAREEPMNNAVLVIVIHTNFATFVMDSSYLNMARMHREVEIQKIIRSIDDHGLLSITDYCSAYLPDTSSLAPEKAINKITKAGKIKKLSRLDDYLKLLSVHGIFEIESYLSP